MSSNTSNQLDDSAVVELTGKIMVVAIIVLFVVVVFVFFLHLYAKWFWSRREHDAPTTTRRRRFNFGAGHQELSTVPVLRHGLDPSVLKSIPVVKFATEDFKDGLECSVCLSEVSDGEKARLLPKCNHGFHVECIDMWFQSHSTCPICRNPVSNQSSPNSTSIDSDSSSLEIPATEEASLPTEPQSFPTNVLFWGNETQVNTMGDNQSQGPTTCIAPQLPSSSSSSSSSTSNTRDGAMVIDIPRQMNEEEDSKSPIPTRMRSLKRLLSRDRRVNPTSPSNVDIEQVGRGRS